jgi:acetoin:2,6-dichlorophenolindophenol oxidoreductase subunit alpha
MPDVFTDVKHGGRLGADLLRSLYLKLVQTRCFEEKAARLFVEGKVHGTAHFCIGEEATGVGVCAALEPEDFMAQTHRGHNQSIGRGMSIPRMMAELLGKATGYCKGKGGCMHIVDFALGSLGANGIVGGGLPLAVGAALTQRLKKIDGVTVCFFGDGASNEGTFHESLNLASVWKLPVVFVCVNNGYAMSTAQHRHMNIGDISLRAQGYGMRGAALDGNDVLGIYRATREAREHVKRHGPMLMVLNTYRILGHSKSDAQVYRSREEVEAWKPRCPIKRFREHLLSAGVCAPAELEAMDRQAFQDVEDAYRYADESPEPKVEEVADDVYA